MKTQRFFARALMAVLVCVIGSAVQPACLTANDTDLEELKRVQQKVQQVAKANMNVVVAVTDGVGYGSGVIVSEDGLVLTAGHVLLTGGKDFRVIFPDGREAKAEPYSKNLNVDAGMVRIIEEGPWDFAEMGSADTLDKGDWCVCLGHSGGYELGRRPPVRAGRIVSFEPDQLVTDCVLIGGDSGGPLFDLDGRVIGIHSSIGGSIAENRHVSIATFRKHWDRLIEGDHWGQLPELAGQDDAKPAPKQKRPTMGIRVDRASDAASILLVHPGGAAESAGLLPGDVVLKFDDIFVNNSSHLIDLIKSRQPDDSVQLTIRRNDQEMVLPLILQGR